MAAVTSAPAILQNVADTTRLVPIGEPTHRLEALTHPDERNAGALWQRGECAPARTPCGSGLSREPKGFGIGHQFLAARLVKQHEFAYDRWKHGRLLLCSRSSILDVSPVTAGRHDGMVRRIRAGHIERIVDPDC